MLGKRKSVTMNSVRFVIFACVLLPASWLAAGLSDQRLCADAECKDVISLGTAKIKYSGREKGVLSFNINSPIRIKSKSAGSDLSLWGVEINGREGYAPKEFIKETKVIINEKNLKFTVPVVPPGQSGLEIDTAPTIKSSENAGDVKSLDDFTTTAPLMTVTETQNNEVPVVAPSAYTTGQKPEHASPVQQETEIIDGTELPILDDTKIPQSVQTEEENVEKSQISSKGEILIEGTSDMAVSKDALEKEGVNANSDRKTEKEANGGGDNENKNSNDHDKTENELVDHQPVDTKSIISNENVETKPLNSSELSQDSQKLQEVSEFKAEDKDAVVIEKQETKLEDVSNKIEVLKPLVNLETEANHEQNTLEDKNIGDIPDTENVIAPSNNTKEKEFQLSNDNMENSKTKVDGSIKNINISTKIEELSMEKSINISEQQMTETTKSQNEMGKEKKEHSPGDTSTLSDLKTTTTEPAATESGYLYQFDPRDSENFDTTTIPTLTSTPQHQAPEYKTPDKHRESDKNESKTAPAITSKPLQNYAQPTGSKDSGTPLDSDTSDTKTVPIVTKTPLHGNDEHRESKDFGTSRDSYTSDTKTIQNITSTLQHGNEQPSETKDSGTLSDSKISETKTTTFVTTTAPHGNEQPPESKDSGTPRDNDISDTKTVPTITSTPQHGDDKISEIKDSGLTDATKATSSDSVPVIEEKLTLVPKVEATPKKQLDAIAKEDKKEPALKDVPETELKKSANINNRHNEQLVITLPLSQEQQEFPLNDSRISTPAIQSTADDNIENSKWLKSTDEIIAPSQNEQNTLFNGNSHYEQTKSPVPGKMEDESLVMSAQTDNETPQKTYDSSEVTPTENGFIDYQSSESIGSSDNVIPQSSYPENEPVMLPAQTKPDSMETPIADNKEQGLFATILDTVNNFLPNGKKEALKADEEFQDDELQRILYPDRVATNKKKIGGEEYCEKLSPNDCPSHASGALQHDKSHSVENGCHFDLTNMSLDMFLTVAVDKMAEMSELLACLAIASVTCLFFLFMYYCFCNSSREGSLLSRLNTLERSLLATQKENAILKQDLLSTCSKLSSIEDNSFGSNDMVMALKKELEEELVGKHQLQEQVANLEKELENAAEAGLELNKIVSELLNNQPGDESIISSVEELQKQLNEQQKTILDINANLAEKSRENSELQLMIAEQNARLSGEIASLQQDNDELETEKSNLQTRLEEVKQEFEEDITKALEGKNYEIKRLQNDIVELTTKWEMEHTKLQTSLAKVEALEECLRAVRRDPSVNINKVIDVANVRAELLDIQKKCATLKERLDIETDGRKLAEEHVKAASVDIEKLKQDFHQSEKDKLEAQTRLEVLSHYFKEKETQLQKELSLKEAMWLKQQGEKTSTVDRLTTMQEEIQSLKSQNDSLRAEIEAQLAAHKAQTGTLENRAHESWLAAKQSERRCEEARAESAALRRKLTIIAGGTDVNFDKMGSGDLNNAPSPIHMEPAGSPLLGRLPPPPPFLPPPFMGPPPPFMGMPPPFVQPGEMRPPPLGRLMSPPPEAVSGGSGGSSHAAARKSRYSPTHIDYDDYDDDDDDDDDEEDYEDDADLRHRRRRRSDANGSWDRDDSYSPLRSYRTHSPEDSRYNYTSDRERDLISTYDTELDYSPPQSPRDRRQRATRAGSYKAYSPPPSASSPINATGNSGSKKVKGPASSESETSYNASRHNKKGGKSAV